MTRKIICIIVISCLFLNGCNTGEKINNADKTDRNTMLPTEMPGNTMLPSEEPSEEPSAGDIDYAANSNNYWRGVLKKQKKEIDALVNWLKKIEYCNYITFRDRENGVISTGPDNKKTRKRIQAERNYETMKEIIAQNDYRIYNNWFSDQRITILHRFDMGMISGNYCLVYAEGQLKKSEKEYSKKVDKNYYSQVIFYE